MTPAQGRSSISGILQQKPPPTHTHIIKNNILNPNQTNKQNKLSMGVRAFNPYTQEADSLIYTVEFWTSQGYIVRPSLKINKKQETVFLF